MIRWIPFSLLTTIATMHLTTATNCSQKCGKFPDYWCCKADYVCDGYRRCQISYSGIRAWMLVLDYTVPVIFLMICIIVAVCLQHRRESNRQVQPDSFANAALTEVSSLPLSSQTETQIISMIRQQRGQHN